MVQKGNASRLDLVFSALSDSTRRGILARLAEGEFSVGELARPFDMSLPAVSKHLRVLERADLVRQRREGRHRYCRLNGDALKSASDWLGMYRRFWDQRFDALEAYLNETRPES